MWGSPGSKTFMKTPYSSGMIEQDVYQDEDTGEYYLSSWHSEPIVVRLGNLVKEFTLPYDEDEGGYTLDFPLSDFIGDTIDEEGTYYVKIVVKNKTGEVVDTTIARDDGHSMGEPRMEINFEEDTFTAFVGYINYTSEGLSLEDSSDELSIGVITPDVAKLIGGEIPIVTKTSDYVGTTGSPRLFVGTTKTLDIFLNIFGSLYGLVSRSGSDSLLPLIPQQTYKAFLAPYSGAISFDPRIHRVPCAQTLWLKGTFTKDGVKFDFGNEDHTDYLKINSSVSLGTVMMKLKFNTTPTSESLIFKIISDSDNTKWTSLVYSPSDKGFILKSSSGSSVKLNSIPIEVDEGTKFSLLFRYHSVYSIVGEGSTAKTSLALVVNNLIFEKETSLPFDAVGKGYIYFGSDGSDSSTSFKGKIEQVLFTSDALPIGTYNFFNYEPLPFYGDSSPRFDNTELSSIKFGEEEDTSGIY